MLTKTVTYDDLNDNPVTETLYFNINKLEILELEIEHGGDLEAVLKRLIESKDNREIYALFKSILVSAYGIKSDDGRRFIKGPEIKKDFESSPALPEIIFDFVKNPEEAAQFIEKCLPQKLIREAKAEQAKNQPAQNTSGAPADNPVEIVTGEVVEIKKTYTDFTTEQLMAMDEKQFFDVLGETNPMKMNKDQMALAYQYKNTH